MVLEAGGFATSPPDLPHVVDNIGSGPAMLVVAHSSANDQDGIELLPGLAAVIGASDAQDRSDAG